MTHIALEQHHEILERAKVRVYLKALRDALYEVEGTRTKQGACAAIRSLIRQVEGKSLE